MIKEYIKGSILDAPQKYIAHGVNCQNNVGSGIAKVLFEKYPNVKKNYHADCNYRESKNCDKHKYLGHYNLAGDESKFILNMFTQLNYGYDGKKYVSYDAIYKGFRNLARQEWLDEVAIPKIGCGLAGGNWEIVSRIIDDATGDDLDVYVYYLEDK
jgi:O-acetyl-ADP-ribose deacetylase (regulator of RNase III)